MCVSVKNADCDCEHYRYIERIDRIELPNVSIFNRVAKLLIESICIHIDVWFMHIGCIVLHAHRNANVSSSQINGSLHPTVNLPSRSNQSSFVDWHCVFFHAAHLCCFSVRVFYFHPTRIGPTEPNRNRAEPEPNRNRCRPQLCRTVISEKSIFITVRYTMWKSIHSVHTHPHIWSGWANTQSTALTSHLDATDCAKPIEIVDHIGRHLFRGRYLVF